MGETCPSSNQQSIDQSTFWSSDGIDWDAHRIGWAIAGGSAALVSANIVINLLNIFSTFLPGPDRPSSLPSSVFTGTQGKRFVVFCFTDFD